MELFFCLTYPGVYFYKEILNETHKLFTFYTFFVKKSYLILFFWRSSVRLKRLNWNEELFVKNEKPSATAQRLNEEEDSVKRETPKYRPFIRLSAGILSPKKCEYRNFCMCGLAALIFFFFGESVSYSFDSSSSFSITLVCALICVVVCEIFFHHVFFNVK